MDAVWNDVETEHDKPCTHTLKGVTRHTQERILAVPDQSRRMADDLETNCVTRQGADATPSNSKKKFRGFAHVKTNTPVPPETTPCFVVKAERWTTCVESTAGEQPNYTTGTKTCTTASGLSGPYNRDKNCVQSAKLRKCEHSVGSQDIPKTNVTS